MPPATEGEPHDRPGHRGRIQAQGGGTEASESWARATPPTERELLEICDRLEAQLSPREQRDRADALARLRQFIGDNANQGGLSAPLKKSFQKAVGSDIRVDLEVITGTAGASETATRA